METGINWFEAMFWASFVVGILAGFALAVFELIDRNAFGWLWAMAVAGWVLMLIMYIEFM